jgi:hypothetical protein
MTDRAGVAQAAAPSHEPFGRHARSEVGMKVRATIPLQTYVNAERAEDLSPTTVFEFKNLQVRVELIGDEALALPGPPVSHFRRVRSLNIELDGDQGLKALLAADKGYELLQVIVKIANRVLLAIRNYGTVAHVQPLKVAADRTDEWLRRLNIETSEDGQNWNSVRPMPSLGSLNLEDILAYKFLPTLEHIGDLDVSDWALVEEAIQDNLQAGPEKEFYTNALEHSRTGNLRLAVVESVICLEIVLTQWLKLVLPTRNVQKVNELVNPQLTLSQRVRLLLPLLLKAKDFERVSLDDVVRTIGYRNKIAHEVGNLPAGVPDDTIRTGISAVLRLSMRLAFERDRLERKPELDRLGGEIRTAFGLPEAKVYAVDRHEYTVGIECSPDDPPNDELMSTIAIDVQKRLVEFDPRFRQDPSVPLVAFNDIGVPFALWVDGRLKKVERKFSPAFLKAFGSPHGPKSSPETQ